MKRKPPVVAITGEHRSDVVTQEDLNTLSDLQAAEWRAQRATQRAAMKIEQRIGHGARVEPGRMEFDGDLRMARTRKERAG